MKFWIHHKIQAAQVDKVRERRKLQRKLQHHQGQRTQHQNEERDEPLIPFKVSCLPNSRSSEM